MTRHRLSAEHEGKRVRLVCCSDSYTRLTPGDTGTLMLIDDLGTWHVAWDSGSTLGLVYVAGDRWETLEGDHWQPMHASNLVPPDAS